MEELRTNDYLKGIVSNLPESPGIYQYLNTEGTIIDVGKAKNLKRRVSSYFNREHEPGKTRVLLVRVSLLIISLFNTFIEFFVSRGTLRSIVRKVPVAR